MAANGVNDKCLTDQYTNRDIFGVVRGQCSGCTNCGGYWKATADYTVSSKDRGRRKHPDNDLSIIDCSRCGCPPASHEALVAENKREAGNDAFVHGQFRAAVAHYSHALSEQPHSAVLLSNRSAPYLAMRWYTQAETDAERAVSLRPDWPKAHARLAAARLGLRKFAQAATCYQRCVALAPASKEYATAFRSAQAAAAKHGGTGQEANHAPTAEKHAEQDRECNGVEPSSRQEAYQTENNAPAAIQSAEARPADERSKESQAGCTDIGHEKSDSCEGRHKDRSGAQTGSTSSASAREQPSMLSIEEEERMERVAAAQRRVKDAESSREALKRTRCDGITQAVRSGCQGCSTCEGFEIWFRAADANDPNVMLFCSRCGCATDKHIVDQEWKAEEERKRAREEAARSARAERRRTASFSAEAAAQDAAAALRVDVNASERQIRRAWRKAALRLHPDKNNGCTEQFLRITQACNMLLNKT
ncbi:hypothetical protein WJX75_005431 [Coccomyxa subellipsoidea]|uniref:J domain-containing protein n=1 Tax=Coccomyxa subellipsoidea TaxID=248742 RepID=A0ABR2YMH3_9CHLO